MRRKVYRIEKTPKSDAFRRFSCFIFWCKTVRKIALIFSATAVTAVLLLSMVNDVLALYKPKVSAEICADDLSDLAERLYNEKIIAHPVLFSVYASVRGGELAFVENKKVTVRGDMDYNQILRAFSEKSSSEVVRISFPRGATTDEIIAVFLKNGIGTKEGFAEAINNYPFEFDFVEELDRSTQSGRKYRLDGYLYPDTYDFYKGRGETYYIYKLLDRFDSVTKSVWEPSTGIPIDDALTLASMIQCSTDRISQYEYLSAVFHNRLKHPEAFPYLECLGTNLYGMGQNPHLHKKAPEDVISSDTPYNTFLYEGLPPGPICNPDINAIICALRPADCNYFYFSVSADGEVTFS